jgi:hypothetical protein
MAESVTKSIVTESIVTLEEKIASILEVPVERVPAIALELLRLYACAVLDGRMLCLVGDDKVEELYIKPEAKIKS